MPQRLSQNMVVQYSIPPYLYQRLQQEAEKEGRTLAGMTREIVKRYVRELDEKAGG